MAPAGCSFSNRSIHQVQARIKGVFPIKKLLKANTVFQFILEHHYLRLSMFSDSLFLILNFTFSFYENNVYARANIRW